MGFTPEKRMIYYARMLGVSVDELQAGARRLGRKPQSLAARVSAGWCPSCALRKIRRDASCGECKPVRSKQCSGGALHDRTKRLRAAGFARQVDAARALGGSPAMVAARVSRGWCRDCAYSLAKGSRPPCETRPSVQHIATNRPKRALCGQVDSGAG